MNIKTPMAIGIDIGGTDTKVCLVNVEGKISQLQRIPTQVNIENPASFFKQVCSVVRKMSAGDEENIVGVGVSCLGLQNDEASGTYLSVNVPELNNFNIRKCLQEFMQLPVTITNDLMSHTLAEYHFGCGKNAKRFLCIALGTGIGAGAVLDGKPVILWGGTSGDCGRIVLEPNAEVICAGKVRGSAEAFCGVAGIEHAARLLYHRDDVCARDVITACREGNDPIAQQVIQSVGEHTGHLIAILAMIYAPTRIALAGGTTNAGPILIDSCRKKFNEIAGEFFGLLTSSAPEYHPEIDICYGEIKGEAGVVGSVVES